MPLVSPCGRIGQRGGKLQEIGETETRIFLAIKTSEGAAICVTWNSHRVWVDSKWQELSCISSLQVWTGCCCQQRLERKNVWWQLQDQFVLASADVVNGETVRVVPSLKNWRIPHTPFLQFIHFPYAQLAIIYTSGLIGRPFSFTETNLPVSNMFFGCLLAARNLKGVICISGVGVAGPKFYIVCLRLPRAHMKKTSSVGVPPANCI